MPVSMIVFADISTFAIGAASPGVLVEGILSCQIQEPAEVRPIYTWGKAVPVVKIGVPTMGNGSFQYIASDGLQSDIDEDFKALLNGINNIYIVTGKTKGNSSVSEAGSQKTITLTEVVYSGKSFGMNARNEGVCTVNFVYKDGLNV